MRSRLASGFTLIEILIAVLVLAVGIIGAAGTQLAAARIRHGSALMSDGVQLASTLAERMRANTLQMQSGAGDNPGDKPGGSRGDSPADNPYLHLHYDASGGPPSPPAVTCYAGSTCTSAQMASFDLYEISAALHDGFPGGRVVVCRDATLWDSAGAALSWQCGAGSTAPIVVKLGWRGKRAGGADDGAGATFAPQVAIVVSEAAL